MSSTIAQSPKKFETVQEPSSSSVLNQIFEVSKMANFNLEVKVLQVNPPAQFHLNKISLLLILLEPSNSHVGEMKWVNTKPIPLTN